MSFPCPLLIQDGYRKIENTETFSEENNVHGTLAPTASVLG